MHCNTTKINPRFWFILLIALLAVSCSSSRRLEKQLHTQIYSSLSLEEGRNDNFELFKEASSWLNTPHKDGGLTRSGIDCSGLVYLVYKNVYGKILERNSAKILKINCKKISMKRLKEGNLVFFNTSGKKHSDINHVGIYLKDNKFVHASTSKGVIVSSLDENYYKKTWVCVGRVK